MSSLKGILDSDDQGSDKKLVYEQSIGSTPVRPESAGNQP